MRTFPILTLLCIVLVSSTAFAEYDVLKRYLFEPELIMDHQRDLGLTEEQRDNIKQVIQEAQTDYVDHQWELEAETEKLEEMLQTSPIDVAAVLTHVDIVLNLENSMKKTQLTMLVRIKNALTDSQQARLVKLRERQEMLWVPE